MLMVLEQERRGNNLDYHAERLTPVDTSGPNPLELKLLELKFRMAVATFLVASIWMIILATQFICDGNDPLADASWMSISIASSMIFVVGVVRNCLETEWVCQPTKRSEQAGSCTKGAEKKADGNFAPVHCNGRQMSANKIRRTSRELHEGCRKKADNNFAPVRCNGRQTSANKIRRTSRRLHGGWTEKKRITTSRLFVATGNRRQPTKYDEQAGGCAEGGRKKRGQLPKSLFAATGDRCQPIKYSEQARAYAKGGEKNGRWRKKKRTTFPNSGLFTATGDGCQPTKYSEQAKAYAKGGGKKRTRASRSSLFAAMGDRRQPTKYGEHVSQENTSNRVKTGFSAIRAHHEAPAMMLKVLSSPQATIRCLGIPKDLTEKACAVDVDFQCPGCHEIADGASKRKLTPYYGFTRTVHGKKVYVFQKPMVISGICERASKSQVCTESTLILHLICAGMESPGSLPLLLKTAIQEYHTKDSLEFVETTFDFSTEKKLDRWKTKVAKLGAKLVQNFKHKIVFVTVHSEVTRGDLFAGKDEGGGDVAMEVGDVLYVVFIFPVPGECPLWSDTIHVNLWAYGVFPGVICIIQPINQMDIIWQTFYLIFSTSHPSSACTATSSFSTYKAYPLRGLPYQFLRRPSLLRLLSLSDFHGIILTGVHGVYLCPWGAPIVVRSVRGLVLRWTLLPPIRRGEYPSAEWRPVGIKSTQRLYLPSIKYCMVM
ncbi:hypothetical protein EDD15DRAFT_2204765 [Pisolithus albus]|nr:hypothetical protein EDD15DRAFT_2204765 [Pisolithus albus]